MLSHDVKLRWITVTGIVVGLGFLLAGFGISNGGSVAPLMAPTEPGGVVVSPLDPTEGMWPQLAAWAFVSISIVVAVYLTDKPYGPAALAGVAAWTILLAIVAVATPRALVCHRGSVPTARPRPWCASPRGSRVSPGWWPG
jgi:hypothetical protein